MKTLDDWTAGNVRGFTYCDCTDPLPPIEHFQALAATGADHARVWLQARWVNGGYVIAEDALLRMDECLLRLESLGMQGVVALSVPADQQPWGDAQRSQGLALLWFSLATRWAGKPMVAAFDLLNEPTPGPPPNGVYTAAQYEQVMAEWPPLAALCIRMLRVADPDRLVVYQVGLGADPSQFKGDPLPLPGVIYSPHVYHPHEVTHQGAAEWNAGSRAFVVQRGYDEAARATLRASLATIAANFKGLPRYVGEFGCCNWVPNHTQYLADVIEWANANGICWAAHAWRGWPGWDYEAVPDGRAAFVSGDTPALRVLRAGLAGQPLPSAPPPPAPTPMPDPLPPSPAPADLSAYVAALNRMVEQMRADAQAAADRFERRLAQDDRNMKAHLRAADQSDADVAVAFHAALLRGGSQMTPDTMAATVAEHVRAFRARWPAG